MLENLNAEDSVFKVGTISEHGVHSESTTEVESFVTLNDIVAHKAFDVLSFIAALKPNKRTKEPSVVFTQEDAMLTLQELTQLIHMVGWQVDFNTKENGNVEFTLSKQ